MSATPSISHLSFNDGLQLLHFLLELGVLRIHLGQQLLELVNILDIFPGRSAPPCHLYPVICTKKDPNDLIEQNEFLQIDVVCSTTSLTSEPLRSNCSQIGID